MAFFSSVSVKGFADYGSLPRDTFYDFLIWTDQTLSAKPRRVGYFYLIGEDPSKPLEHMLALRGGLYTPGYYGKIPVPTTIGFPNLRLQIQWDEGAIPFKVFY